tara:strand:- start:4920 stop:5852 length:933 start_codon:yes stop_codon:yes gene_type:complete
MVSKFDVLIIGENLLGLYAGIKCIEKGLSVLIVEKLVKEPPFISGNPILIVDTHKHFKKLCSNYKIDLEYVPNLLHNHETLQLLITKSEKIPSVLQNSITFEQLCVNIIGNQGIKILKKTFEYYDNIKYYNAVDALYYLKKNYLLHNHYTLKNNSNHLLKKLRKTFINYGGIINYSSPLQHFKINQDNTFLSTLSNNQNVYSNIIISTLNNYNLSYIYNWSPDIQNTLSSSYTYDPLSFRYIHNHLITNFNIATPMYNELCNSHKFVLNSPDSQIFGKSIKFFICNDFFSKNKNWFEGSFDLIHLILRSI